MNPRKFVPSQDTVVDLLNAYGPKALLYTAIAFPIKALHAICKEDVVATPCVVTPQEAHSKINLAAVCTTAAGWLDFATTAFRAYQERAAYALSQGRHYPYGLSGKIGAGLFAAAATVGGVGLQKSGAPGEEMTAFACVATSGVLAATASIFVKKEIVNLKSGKIPPIEQPLVVEDNAASAPADDLRAPLNKGYGAA